MKKKRIKPAGRNSFRVISVGFMILILTEVLLLMLPIASQSRTVTPFKDTLFTAISASCVTGLVVKDTATHWSLFGQAVILTLIQIGGMGVITIGLIITRLSGRKIGLGFRGMMQDSISAPQVGGMLKLTKFILKTTALIELTGAALLYPVFCRDFGAVKGIWYSIFHSVSAFCNAGFDLMGVREPFSSLTSYGGNTYVNVVLMLLIITGGTCAVNFCTTADGLFYSISTGTKFVDSEGNDIDNGIEPHYMLVKIDEEGENDFSDVYNFDNLSKLFKEYYKLDDAPEPETTTDIASPTTETSTVSTDKGNVLDTYTIDPATGKGKDSKGNNVDLPQTGINSMKKVAAAAVAVSFMTIGAGLVYVSGVGRKKKDNSKTT